MGRVLPTRLPAVLDAIYAPYGLAREDASGPEPEAVSLARWLAERLPAPEGLGLLSQLLFCASRRAARRGGGGTFVPLDAQDTALWDRGLMRQAADALAQASASGMLGRYQLEAAVQSVHARRAEAGHTDWQALALLYQGLMTQAPALGCQLGYISALSRAQDAQAAWPLLAALDADLVRDYQPYWALRAELLQQLGDAANAAHAYEVAAGLCDNEATRRFLRGCRHGLPAGSLAR